MLSFEEFPDWLRLLETPGVGRESARRLLAALGSPARVFEASGAVLREVVVAPVAAALGKLPPEFETRLSAARAWLDGGEQRHLLTLGDSAYPSALLQTADPPLLLYVQGRLSLLAQDSVAVVGSRNPTPQGAENARAFGSALAAQGFVVVSGLALGVDAAAHTGALEGGGSTIAVVGTGLDQVYPTRHRALAQRIGQQGALVSEFAPGTPPLQENFPQRNRIIAGLARGTLVVEAALKSGSLITARLAGEAGREVFAIPGSIHSPQSKGCHALIKQGAKLVESAEDIIEELRGSLAMPRMDAEDAPRAPGASDPVLQALGHDATTLDAIAARTGWPTPELLARLLELELQGDVARLPGGLYQRCHRG